METSDIKKLLDAKLSRERAKELLIELVKVPSPQTDLLEEEPLLKEFIKKAIEPRLRAMGFADIRYDTMGNLIATYGSGESGKSLMFIGNAMNQPASKSPAITPPSNAPPMPNRIVSRRPSRRSSVSTRRASTPMTRPTIAHQIRWSRSPMIAPPTRANTTIARRMKKTTPTHTG